MTTQTLRKIITVTQWSLTDKGALISYTRNDKGNKQRNIVVPPNDLVSALNAMAMIDDYTPGRPIVISMDGCSYTFENFVRNYTLSQWEAISLAVRAELETENALAMENWEIDELFKSLL